MKGKGGNDEELKSGWVGEGLVSGERLRGEAEKEGDREERREKDGERRKGKERNQRGREKRGVGSE